MSAMAAPRGVRAFVARPEVWPSWRLVRGGFLASTIALVVSAAAGLALGGLRGLVTAAVAGLVVVAFFATGQFSQLLAMGEGSTHGLGLTLLSYSTRVLVLGMILFAAWQSGGVDALHLPALLVAVVVSTFGWVAGLIWTHQHLHLPIYDTEYVAPKEDA